MTASLPRISVMEDGTRVMACREIAVFSRLKYSNFLSRLRRKVDENPRCWKFFPGIPHPIPAKKSLEDYHIKSTASGIDIMFHEGATKRALLGAFTAGGSPDDGKPEPDVETTGDSEDSHPASTAGDEKFLVVRPSTDDREPMADSRDVASYFGKRHDNVLRSYKNLGCSPGFRRLNFEECYINGLDGDLSRILMTKNGFAFLALGFTGAKADLFKEAFINKYDSMERRQGQAGGWAAPDLNDPATLRQMLIGATYKIEEANARTSEAKQETEEERKLRITAEARANAETQRALNEEERANREEAAKVEAMLHAKEADETLESVLERISENTGNWQLEPFAQVQLHASPVNQLRDAMLTGENKMLKRHFYEPIGKFITLPEQWTIVALLLDTKMTQPAGLKGVQVPSVVVTPKGQRYLLRRYWGKFKTAAPISGGAQPALDLKRKSAAEP